jgi:phospholipase C
MNRVPALSTSSKAQPVQSLIRRLLVGITAICILTSSFLRVPATVGAASGLPAIHTVFIILMENHDWSDFTASNAPYIRTTLVGAGAHSEQYFNPPNIHPSLPNYLWLEAGKNFGILDDNDPSSDHQSTTQHLTTMLTAAGITWKAYEEDISGTDCPLNDVNNYAVRHDPFVYFDDVTNTLNPSSANCIQHVRPFPELATDLANNTVARYNFITPNVIDDMHDGTIKQGDNWLKANVPTIMNSAAYKNGGVLFVTWDESENSDGPIGMIALSPFAKVNYSNSIHYDHSSTLRTIQEIFGITPLLGGAASATDLSDFFTTTAVTVNPPTNVKVTTK